MVKAAGKTAFGTGLLFLGLSGENVTRLAAGESVKISQEDMQELGLPPLVVIIGYGRTEQDILDDLKARGIVLKGLPE